ncbi:hypothetical protein CYMTET_54035 [Cymbomonas tetramitiformis]|uniref:Glycosyl transferase family 1 domain-containing protein n=1 Tax=Cymbomonas tetramitiformis TaxID=36881 RepID=A0AAE0BGZ2_9CHLO|nr:hypothetical protein CYMTET_54035 [Cymbomonas tetramitiformis]
MFSLIILYATYVIHARAQFTGLVVHNTQISNEIQGTRKREFPNMAHPAPTRALNKLPARVSTRKANANVQKYDADSSAPDPEAVTIQTRPETHAMNKPVSRYTSEVSAGKPRHIFLRPEIRARQKVSRVPVSRTSPSKEGSFSLSVTWKLPVGCDFSGFFLEVLGYLVALEGKVPNLGVDMGTCSEEMFGMLAPQEAEILRRVTLRARTVPHADVLILHTPPRDYATHTPTQRPKFVVGRSMTEALKLPPQEAVDSRTVDQVWVPTTWHRNVYVDAGVEASKVVVVPEAVDVDFFDPEAAVAATHRRQPVEGVAVPDRVHEAGQRRRFVFFSVFKFEFRKGWDVLLKAFWAEFLGEGKNQADVELVIRSYRPSWEPGPKDITVTMDEVASRWQGKGMTQLAKVTWLKDDLSRAELRDQYLLADAFVLPTRGEGWGLPVVEAMSMALPVIVTNFSGPTEYITEENAYPLSYKGVDSAGRCKPDGMDLQRLMRRVFDNREEARQKGERARQDMVMHFGPSVVGDIVLSSLNNLVSMDTASTVDS